MMTTTYEDALHAIRKVASTQSNTTLKNVESIEIGNAVNRVSAQTYMSQIHTPKFDTSAMDGYAVNSLSTKTATPERPLLLCIHGRISAGQMPVMASPHPDEHGCIPAVEIMTGAKFPDSSVAGSEFDACIKIEDTRSVSGPDLSYNYCQIVKPAKFNQNRRLAGTDFSPNDIIISRGDQIKPQHVMALAAISISRIIVYPRVTIGIISTGLELKSHDCCSHRAESWVNDTNGPYIESSLRSVGVITTRLGIARDDNQEFEKLLTKASKSHDMLISTGAVSMGAYDFIPSSLERVGADIRFHKVAIRPGHPVLFASLPAYSGQGNKDLLRATSITSHEHGLPFFGLPGNPMAVAVCLRFLVVPYLQALYQAPLKEFSRETPVWAILQPQSIGNSVEFPLTKPIDLRVFWHSRRFPDGTVAITEDQASNKIRPFLDGNCWVSIPPGRKSLARGDELETYELYPQSLGRA